jgi:hypothetical protein
MYAASPHKNRAFPRWAIADLRREQPGIRLSKNASANSAQSNRLSNLTAAVKATGRKSAKATEKKR